MEQNNWLMLAIAIVGVFSLYQQSRIRRQDVELQRAKTDSVTAKSQAQQASAQNARIDAMMRLVEKTVGDAVTIAMQFPSSLELLNNSIREDQAKILDVVKQSVDLNSRTITEMQTNSGRVEGAVNQAIAAAAARYAAINALAADTNGKIDGLTESFDRLEQKIDGLDLLDKKTVLGAIESTKTEILNKIESQFPMEEKPHE